MARTLLVILLSTGLLQAQISLAFHNGTTTANAMATRPDGDVVATSAQTWNNPGNNGLQGLVFDNFALALLFGLVVGGGSEVAQRAADKTD